MRCLCWVLQDIEERILMIRDQVLTPTCQLYYDYNGPHKDNLYGEPAAAHVHTLLPEMLTAVAGHYIGFKTVDFSCRLLLTTVEIKHLS